MSLRSRSEAQEDLEVQERSMEIQEALVILTEFNRWRRDNDDVVEMPPPALIGEAIDVMIEFVGTQLTKDE